MTTQPIGNVPTQEPFIDITSGILSRAATRWLAKLISLPEPFSSYTPVVSAGSGSITTATATGRYRRIGKLIFIQIAATITTNGSGASWVYVSLPFAAVNVTGVDHVLTGRAVAISGKMLQGQILPNESRCAIFNYDNTYPGASGEALIMNGFYEVA